MVNYDSPTATDSVDDSVDVTCVPASGTVFNEGRTRVTCTATDDSGNTVNTTFNVDVTIFNTTIFFDNFEDRNLDGCSYQTTMTSGELACLKRVRTHRTTPAPTR